MHPLRLQQIANKELDMWQERLKNKAKLNDARSKDAMNQ
jgi:hypothetical protein